MLDKLKLKFEETTTEIDWREYDAEFWKKRYREERDNNIEQIYYTEERLKAWRDLANTYRQAILDGTGKRIPVRYVKGRAARIKT